MRFVELHIETEDLKRAEAFYADLIPHQKIVRWPDGNAIAFVLPDGSAFGIWKKGKIGLHDGRGGQHLHYAFQIAPAEYDDMKKKLESKGIEVIEHAWRDGQRSLYFFDPDGHQGEFLTKDWLTGQF